MVVPVPHYVGAIRWRGRRRGRGMQETSYNMRDLLGWVDHLSWRTHVLPPFRRPRLRVAEPVPRSGRRKCLAIFFLKRQLSPLRAVPRSGTGQKKSSPSFSDALLGDRHGSFLLTPKV